MNQIVNLETNDAESTRNEIMELPSNEVMSLEERIKQVEDKIKLAKKIRLLVCEATNLNDWTVMKGKRGEEGKPYLQCHGAEKLADIFGISWDEPQYSKEDLTDGHYIYTCTMRLRYDKRTISSIGTRASNTPFFSRKYGEDVPPEAVDKANIKKSSYTNCLGNGIKRMLGIRDLTWEEIRGKSGGGVQKIGRANEVNYGNKQAPNKAVSAPATEDPNIISKAQVDYARSLCHQIGFKGNQLNEFLHKHAVSVTADKIAQMPRAEAKVFIEKLISLKDGEIV